MQVLVDVQFSDAGHRRNGDRTPPDPAPGSDQQEGECYSADVDGWCDTCHMFGLLRLQINPWMTVWRSEYVLGAIIRQF